MVDVEVGSPLFMTLAGNGRHPGVAQILRYFAWSHLPESLQPISKTIAGTAIYLLDVLPDGPELTAGLRKLLEAKDCFVRAALDTVETS